MSRYGSAVAAGGAGGAPVPEWTHLDLQGSAVAATDATGAVCHCRGLLRLKSVRRTDFFAAQTGCEGRESYRPFGRTRLDPPANDDDTGYTGHLKDDATGLNYMQARYYDPAIGRFYSTDPIGYQDQLNLYAYVHNDPVNLTDPTGEKSKDQDEPMPPQGNTSSRVGASTQAGFYSGDNASGDFAMGNHPSQSFSIVMNADGSRGKTYTVNHMQSNVDEVDDSLRNAVSATMEAATLPLGGPAAKTGGLVAKGLGNIGSHGVVDAGAALNSAIKWLGSGYSEISPGVFRSADNLRQFRMTNRDLIPTHGKIGSHVHFEQLNSSGKVIENLHLPITP